MNKKVKSESFATLPRQGEFWCILVAAQESVSEQPSMEEKKVGDKRKEPEPNSETNESKQAQPSAPGQQLHEGELPAIPTLPSLGSNAAGGQAPVLAPMITNEEVQSAMESAMAKGGDDETGQSDVAGDGTKPSHKRDGTFAAAHAYRKKKRPPLEQVTLEPDVDKRRRLFNRHWKKIADEAARLHACTGATVVALVLPYTHFALPVGAYKKKEKPLVMPMHLGPALAQPLEKLENQILHAAGLPPPNENFRSMSRHQLSSMISDRMKTYCKRYLGRGGVCWGDPQKRPEDFPVELWQPLKNLKDSVEPGGPTRKDKLVRILEWLEGKMAYQPNAAFGPGVAALAAQGGSAPGNASGAASSSSSASVGGPFKRMRTGSVGIGGSGAFRQHSAAFNSLAMAARNAAGGYDFDPSLAQADSAISSAGAVLSETAEGKALFLQNLRANILQLEFLSSRHELRPPGVDDAMLEERLKSLREYLAQVETWPSPWEMPAGTSPSSSTAASSSTSSASKAGPAKPAITNKPAAKAAPSKTAAAKDGSEADSNVAGTSVPVGSPALSNAAAASKAPPAKSDSDSPAKAAESSDGTPPAESDPTS
eukprot:g18958.t1